MGDAGEQGRVHLVSQERRSHEPVRVEHARRRAVVDDRARARRQGAEARARRKAVGDRGERRGQHLAVDADPQHLLELPALLADAAPQAGQRPLRQAVRVQPPSLPHVRGRLRGDVPPRLGPLPPGPAATVFVLAPAPGSSQPPCPFLYGDTVPVVVGARAALGRVRRAPRPHARQHATQRLLVALFGADEAPQERRRQVVVVARADERLDLIVG
ncbi:TPA_asm: UL27.6 [Human alphaherpesvirus 1]|nr:TPA_asm: UL27.6 [Human alphaherpesvirus 1]